MAAINVWNTIFDLKSNFVKFSRRFMQANKLTKFLKKVILKNNGILITTGQVIVFTKKFIV